VASLKPLARKTIVVSETIEPVPLVVDRLYPGQVGPPELLAQLQIIWGIGENDVNRLCRERRKNLDTVPV
jgi:hypothetical protein